jgi:3-hydroxyisobutyrate dehydrogenase-like beta-hydroxyacid dehydrogenase
MPMVERVALIGFGEAASAFVGGWAERPAGLRAFDIKTLDPSTAAAKRADFAAACVVGADSAAEALNGATVVLSLVTADQALAVAEEAAGEIEAGALFFDMNSAAPDTKRAAARQIKAAGGKYLDVAVMAPVHPAGAAVPLMVSGPHGEEGAQVLSAIGFGKVRVVSDEVGYASSIKMIRSVIVKGIEALTAECVLAADRAGVLTEVLASLDVSSPPKTWAERADYNLDRMMVHGLRRAAEMEEVVKTLDALGTGAAMARGTVERQRAIGGLGHGRPPAGLDAKLAALADASRVEAA